MTRNVEPGTGVPSGVRTAPASWESAGVIASGLSCAASGTPKAENNKSSPAGSTASLLPNNFHVPSSPLEDTDYTLLRFQYSQPGGRPDASLIHPVHS
jgi:hypothetical protein